MAGYLKPFNFNANDIQFILDQLNFKPLFRKDASGTLVAIIGWDGTGAIYDQNGIQLWDGTHAITYVDPISGQSFDVHDAATAVAAFGTSYASLLDSSGLRQVSGQFNNLYDGRQNWGAIDQPFVRMVAADASNYTSKSIPGLITDANGHLLDPTVGATFTETSPTTTTDVFLGRYTTYVQVFNPVTHTFTSIPISYDLVDRTTVDVTTSTQKTDGHHLHVSTATIATTTSTSTQTYIHDLSGYQAVGAPTVSNPSAPTVVTTQSGGELDATLHAQLGALDLTNPANGPSYVSGFYRVDGQGGSTLNGMSGPTTVGAVDLTNAKNFDYTVTAGANGSAVMNSVVDYTPRMISNLVASGGVVTLKDGAGHIVYWSADKYASDTAYKSLIDTWNADHPAGGAGYVDTSRLVEGAAIVTDWGLIAHDGGTDTQNPANGEVYVGAANPGIAATNGIFTLFGQFFDHGLDFISKSSRYKVVIPLAIDDPLYNAIGPDGQPVTSITITRADPTAGNAMGPDGANYTNHDSPYIDQNQTYGTVDDVTNLLRAWYVNPVTGKLEAGSRLFDGKMTQTWTDGFGNTSTDTLPTLNELRAYVTSQGRTELTWEDVAQNLRHRDAAGHVAYYDANGQEVAYLDAAGAAHWVDPSNATPVSLAGLTVHKTGQVLLLDMNPRFDTAHLSGAAATAAMQTLGLNFGSDGQISLNALAKWINFADFSIQKTLYGAPNGTPLTDAEVKAVNELLLDSVGDHYIAGDGRANENFGLTSIHHVFHEEHNYQVQNLEAAIVNQDARGGDPTHADAHKWQLAVTAPADFADTNTVAKVGSHLEAAAGTYLARDGGGNYFVVEGTTHTFSPDATGNTPAYVLDIDGNRISAAGSYVDASGYLSWNQDMIFNGAKLTVEMEYQHAAVDQYARAVSPNIQEFAGTSSGENAAVTLEYSQAAFRFGHSQLRETIDTMDPTGGITAKVMSYALEAAFLHPEKFASVGPGAIVLGMERQQSNEIDEFVTPALQQGLLGQPLDLATINIARGRDLNLPTLNGFREAAGFTKYHDWLDFKANMIHPDNLVNFIAAYSFDGDVAHAQAILDAYGNPDPAATATYRDGSGVLHTVTKTEAFDFLQQNKDVDKIDLWLGGLAEVHVSGGVLGETFDAIFVSQITKLMDDDRFYYLQRLVNQQFGDEVINEQFKDIFERTTGNQHLNGNIFGYADAYYDEGRNALASSTIDPATGKETDVDATGSIALSKNGGVTTAVVNAGLLAAMGEQHKYGQLISAYDAAFANDPTQKHIGIWSDNAVDNSRNGTIVHLTPPNAPAGGGAGPLSPTGEPTPAASVAKDYIFDGRPNLTGDATNADGTAQSGFDSSEVVVGTKYDDFIRLGPADDTAYAEDGNDIVYGGSPTTSASAGGASAGLDHLYGGAGDDTMYGEDMPDLMDGGSGDDLLYGGSSGSSINGVDQVIGSEGNDTLYGNTGIDKLYGGLGDDVMYGGDDTDPFFDAGDGNDYANGDSGQDIIYGGNGDDIIDGGKGIDLLYGDAGDDILRQGDGDSQINGNGNGGDDLIGGDGVTDTGYDLVDYSQQSGSNGYSVDLNAQFAGQLPADLTPLINNGVAFTTTNVLFEIEGAIGSKNNDVLTGDSTGDPGALVSHGDNWLVGGSGNDSLTGNGGNDIIVGGSIRLDALIGKYTLNGSTDPSVVYWNDTVHTIDGASHRAKAGSVLTGGLLDAAAGDGVTFEKHFTDLLQSGAYKDFVLGDSNPDGTQDVAVYRGSFNDYTVTKVDYQGLTAYRIHDTRDPATATYDGTDLVIGVEKFIFADHPNGIDASTLLDKGPAFDAPFAFTMAEPVSPGASLVAGTVNAHDQDAINVNPGGGLVYAITGGADAALFTIDQATGALSFLSAPNFELPAAAGGGNTYSLTVQASDGLRTTSQAVTVAVTDAPEAATGTLDIAYRRNPSNNNPSVSLSINSSLHDGDLVSAANSTGAVPITNATVTWHRTTLSGTALSNVSGPNLNNQTNVIATATVTYTDAFGSHSVDGSEKIYIGSTGSNTIGGSNGNDVILGLNGSDTINWSSGSDVYDGGNGNDTVSFAGAATGVVVDLGANATSPLLPAGVTAGVATDATGTVFKDYLVSIERVIGSDNADTLIGSATADTLIGGGGDDRLTGGAGSDVIDGGNGNDTAVFGGAVVDATFTLSINGLGVGTTGGGTDTVSNVENLAFADGTFALSQGNTLNNVISGGAGSDLLLGFGGNDNLSGNDGNDVLIGGTGNDIIDGGAGTDTAVFSGNVANATFALTNNGLTVSTAGSGTDTVSNVETFAFADGSFTLVQGDNAGNALTGGSGSDLLLGLGGNDSLTGGAGNDVLVGGTGNDTFVFAANFGKDTITDFTVGTNLNHDTINIHAALVGAGIEQDAQSYNFNTLMANNNTAAVYIQNVGGGFNQHAQIVIKVDATTTETIDLLGVTKNALVGHAADFIL